MREKKLREEDFLKLIEGLDITPTMYHSATEKYKAVGTYLQKAGLKFDVYPQGSFSLGTVVRPYKNSEEASYDLDFICCIDAEKEKTQPGHIKNIVKDLLKRSERYREILLEEEYDKCWTLEYAKVSEIDFNIDIVPAVPESETRVIAMQNDNLTYEQAKKAVAITNKENSTYSWVTSNPRAYRSWFETINNPFLMHDRLRKRQNIYNKNKGIYNSIEDIPEEIERSSLQRVIQILKHHRDIYFCKNEREELKPTSAIITTICAEIAKEKNTELSVFELLQEIADDFEIYSQQQIMSEDDFSSKYQSHNIIKKSGGQWYIINPVNPLDNLADSWNNDGNRKASAFFGWVRRMKQDILGAFHSDDTSYVALMENTFGSDYVKRHIDLNEYDSTEPNEILSTPKPWRNANA